jgi:signal transduction histidine kinase
VEPEPQESPSIRLAEWIDRIRRSRDALVVVSVAPILFTLLVALSAQPLAPTYTLPCPLYPNATIAFTSSLHEACPLEYPDRLTGIVRGNRVAAIRSDGEVRAQLANGEPAVFRVQPLRGAAREMAVTPVLVHPREAAVRLAAAFSLAMILVVTVLLTAVRAGVPASLPSALIHAVVGAGIVSTVAGATTSAFEVGDAISRASLAGAVMHLGLVFPQRRGIVEQFPEAVAAPYVFAYVVGVIEIEAAYGGSALSTVLAQRMLMGLIGLGLCLLAMGCYFTVRESASQLARGQARAFIGGLALVALPLSLTSGFGSASLKLASATVAAALLPFPIGYAISRYEAADKGASLRKVLAQALYLTLWSASIFVVIYALQQELGLPAALRHPTVIFSGVYCTLLLLDPLRARLEQRVHTLIVSQRIDWEGLGREYAQRIAAQRNDEGIAGAVASAIRSGLGETGVGILVAEGDGFAVVEAVGSRGLVDVSLAEALADWSTDAVTDLNGLAALSGPLKEAHDAGVCAFARAEANGRLVACLVLVHQKRGRMLGSSEKQWVATVADLTASALVSTQLERELRIAERFAARGRMESELAHDLGKPLGALELTAQKLVDSIDPSDAIVPHLRKITRLAAHVHELTRSALEHGQRSRAKLEDLVQVACLEIRSLHGEQRVIVHELPDLGELPQGFEQLVRVLVNLLDNALRASRPEDEVELRARCLNEHLELSVEDRGAGMSPDQLRRAFVPFASFRAGGTGLGLAITRQIVTALGGRLTLTPRADGCGMVAVARLPLRVPPP